MLGHIISLSNKRNYIIISEEYCSPECFYLSLFWFMKSCKVLKEFPQEEVKTVVSCIVQKVTSSQSQIQISSRIHSLSFLARNTKMYLYLFPFFCLPSLDDICVFADGFPNKTNYIMFNF